MKGIKQVKRFQGEDVLEYRDINFISAQQKKKKGEGAGIAGINVIEYQECLLNAG